MAISLSVASVCAIACLAPMLATQSITSIVSVDSAGAHASGGGSFRADVSADGRYVVFASDAVNLVPGDTNGVTDIFLRDLASGSTSRVSVSSSGAQADGFSRSPSISADGQFVVFSSDATNLVPGDTNSRRDIFVRDLNSGDTTRVSVSTTGAQGDASAFIASISGDGRYVAFDTRAALVASDTNNYVDVYLRDRLLNQTLHVSAPLIASSTPGGSNDPDITPDGRYIAYASQDFTVVAADTNAGYDAYVYDVVTGQTTIASVDSSGVQGPSDQHQGVSISDDGRFVAFASDAALVAGDTNNVPDYYVHDQTTGQTVRVSVDSLGAQANAFLWLAPPVISGDGRYVAFASTATNLVSGDINGVTDVFLHDRVFGVTSMVSVNPAGLPSNAQSGRPALSRDARYVLFDSKATDLVAGDINGVDDVFRVDRGASAPQTYCTAGVTFNGCQAQIAASSNPSASAANSCSITVSDVEGQRAGVIFYGIDNSNFTPLPWGTGTSFLCVKSPHQRTGTQNSGGTAGTCSGSFALDWNAFQQSNPSSLGQPWTSGATVYAQAWFRDPPSAKSTHLSNALRLTYLP